MSIAFEGAWTALITPFKAGEIDDAAYDKLIEHQISGGIFGLVVCGTTGESVTLTSEEKLHQIKRTVELAKGRVPVMAGTGSSSTRATVDMTRRACELGVDAVLVVTPAYNKPTQAGLVEHFRQVSSASSKPIMLYNVPGRTACNMLPATVAEIAKSCSNVVAIKEAGGSVAQMSECHRLAPSVTLMSGDDALALPSLAVGSTGVVSVLSNLAPKQVGDVIRLYNEGKRDQAIALHEKLVPAVDAIFAEANPTPIKYCMSKIGIGDDSVRPPLLPATPALRERLDRIMQELGYSA